MKCKGLLCDLILFLKEQIYMKSIPPPSLALYHLERKAFRMTWAQWGRWAEVKLGIQVEWGWTMGFHNEWWHEDLSMEMKKSTTLKVVLLLKICSTNIVKQKLVLILHVFDACNILEKYNGARLTSHVQTRQ
jgi:hypothetical protein